MLNSEVNTYIFFLKQQKLIFRFFDILRETGNDDRVGSVERREPDVHFVCLHKFTDGAALGTDQTAVNARVNWYRNADLVLLKKIMPKYYAQKVTEGRRLILIDCVVLTLYSYRTS